MCYNNNNTIFISLKGLLQIAMGLIGVTTVCYRCLMPLFSVHSLVSVYD